MNKELRTTNLFKYATSELSQDAFICWLLSHATQEGWDDEPQLRKCAISLINLILKPKKKIFTDDMKVIIQKQYCNIDVYVSVGDMHIIIEDKTFTDTHDKQINRYKSILTGQGILDENIICVYYKIVEQPFPEANVDVEFTRKKLLDFFKQFKSSSCYRNSIFHDYLDYLEYIDSKVSAYSYLDINNWDHYAYIGFFKHLQDTFFISDSVSWKYVSNASGGFMGLWWYFLTSDELNKMGLTQDICDEVYLQIENNIIAVKYKLDSDKYKNNIYNFDIINEKRMKIFNCLNNMPNGDFRKKPFKRGQYMTIGYLKYTYENYKDIFTLLHQSLKQMKL